MMFYRFVVASAFVILSFASSVTGQGACIPRPCTNGGCCVSGRNTYRCYCFNEYTGQNCTQ
ncbi:Multimerin-1, partial [Acropora cervicornis]